MIGLGHCPYETNEWKGSHIPNSQVRLQAWDQALQFSWVLSRTRLREISAVGCLQDQDSQRCRGGFVARFLRESNMEVDLEGFYCRQVQSHWAGQSSATGSAVPAGFVAMQNDVPLAYQRSGLE